MLWKNKRAVGVEYVDSNGKKGRIACRKEVLLTAGSIKSPQILQLSGVGPTHVLEPLNVSTSRGPVLRPNGDSVIFCLFKMQIAVVSELPVGENLQDHLQVPLFVELKNSSVSMNIAKLLRPSQLWNYMAHGKGKSLPSSGHRRTNFWLCVDGIGAFATSGIEGVAAVNGANSSSPSGMLILFNMGSIDADLYSTVANIKKEVLNFVRPLSGRRY